MKVLITGTTGYIGKRLLPLILDQGYDVVCCVRDKERFPKIGNYAESQIEILEIDFLDDNAIDVIPSDIDIAYYLIHSMSSSTSDFETLESDSAQNFVKLIDQTACKQIIYLGGIINESELSKHLRSRKNVELLLREAKANVTALKAGIIVGSGSASFEIIRDLVEKLPVMITPKWLNTKCQPIGIRNVLEYLVGVLGNDSTLDRSFDIGGPDVLTYEEMLLQFAAVRGLTRYIFIVPVMTPKLSSYWLYFVTATSYKLAANLVDSMKIEVVAKPNELANELGIIPMPYGKAVELAFQRIEQNNVISSWKDAVVSSFSDNSLYDHINVPQHGCFVDSRSKIVKIDSAQVLENIWHIGGERGWYYGNWLWILRGYTDKLFGGVGLRRGRRSPTELTGGDPVDFLWVVVADKANSRLLLYAEMKLPGEAWLEFKLEHRGSETKLIQTATFRPKGLLGRLYWYAVLPFHFFVFEGMMRNILKFKA
jgi:uncharacterized protein YbjT (DUF2867 family)